MFKEIQWRKFSLLDHGYVALVDKMGDDSSITQAAKVSFGNDERSKQDRHDYHYYSYLEEKCVPIGWSREDPPNPYYDNKDWIDGQEYAKQKVQEEQEALQSGNETLIRYLMRHRHSSPFEMVELKFLIRCPIFVARQWMRHRTWSYNEISGRYTELPNDHYTPKEWRLQSKNNKQGSDEVSYEGDFDIDYEAECYGSKQVYDIACNNGIAKELARCILPVSTYTEFYAKVDLSNLLHFISLRSDPHAQYEIRVYSDAILHQIVKPLFPLCYEAFMDYRLGGMFLSRLDQKVIEKIGAGFEIEESLDDIFRNKREKQECKNKLDKLGIY